MYIHVSFSMLENPLKVVAKRAHPAVKRCIFGKPFEPGLKITFD